MVTIWRPAEAMAKQQVYDGTAWQNQAGDSSGRNKIILDVDNVGVATEATLSSIGSKVATESTLTNLLQATDYTNIRRDYAITHYNKLLDLDNLIVNKLSYLYNIEFLRWFERMYGSTALKQLILDKLKVIDSFDDCLVITDFTQFTETGTGQELPGAGDSATIEKTTDELIITITTDSNTGNRTVWVYTDFASNMSKLFVSCIFIPGPKATMFEVCNASGETLLNPPDLYQILVYPPGSTDDFRLVKAVGGVVTTLASESVDLTEGTEYKVAGYFDVSKGIQKTWREADPVDLTAPTLSASDTEITAIASWRFKVNTSNTSVTETYRYKVPLIVAWKA